MIEYKEFHGTVKSTELLFHIGVLPVIVNLLHEGAILASFIDFPDEGVEDQLIAQQMGYA
ncbi:MAG: hypothetical protein GY861_11730 [bacterium]|nr:hypothetical protein [bacterium]